MTINLTTTSGSITSASSLSFQVTIPEASGTRVYAFCHAGLAAIESPPFSLTSITLHGNAMTLLDSDFTTPTNRRYIEHLYEIIDPLAGGANPTTQTFSVTYNRGLSAIGVTIVIATGVVDRGTPVSASALDATSAISVSLTPSQFPGVIIASGHTRMRTIGGNDNYNQLSFTGDVTEQLSKISTGNTQLTDMIIWTGYAAVDVLDSYDVGWQWPLDVSALLIAIPLYGTADYAEAEFSAIDPEIVYGTATLDGLMGTAEFSGDDPELILGSIPPVQVVGRGQLYLSTAARNISVLLLATTGEYWVVVDAGDATEDLGAIVTRRKGYLTPM